MSDPAQKAEAAYTGNPNGLGLNKKAKKKNPLMQGLLQMQSTLNQQKTGTLSSMAYQQGALGTMTAGVMEEAPAVKKKKVNGK